MENLILLIISFIVFSLFSCLEENLNVGGGGTDSIPKTKNVGFTPGETAIIELENQKITIPSDTFDKQTEITLNIKDKGELQSELSLGNVTLTFDENGKFVDSSKIDFEFTEKVVIGNDIEIEVKKEAIPSSITNAIPDAIPSAIPGALPAQIGFDNLFNFKLKFEEASQNIYGLSIFLDDDGKPIGLPFGLLPEFNEETQSYKSGLNIDNLDISAIDKSLTLYYVLFTISDIGDVEITTENTIPIEAEDGLTLYLKFDDTGQDYYQDSSGNSNFAFKSNIIDTTDCYLGSCPAFSPQSGSYIKINNSNSLNASKSIIFDFWVKQSENHAGEETLINKYNTMSEYEIFSISIKDGVIVSKFRDDESDSWITGDTILNSGEWYHLRVTLDAEKIEIYINDELNTSYSASQNLGISDDPIYIGISKRGEDESFNQFNGNIDELKIYQ